jgi:hypothetical protein
MTSHPHLLRCARIQSIVVSKYSSGMLTKPRGPALDREVAERERGVVPIPEVAAYSIASSLLASKRACSAVRSASCPRIHPAADIHFPMSRSRSDAFSYSAR